MNDRQDCESCKAAYAPSAWDTEEDKSRKSSGPPCGTCRPEIHPLNVLPIEIYQLCSDDWNYTTAGTAGLRAEAINIAIDMLGVKEARIELFRAVKKLGMEISKCQR